MEKKFTLSANPTKNAERYFKALQEISGMKDTFEQKRQAAEVELVKLKGELDHLSAEMMLEANPTRLQEISDKRKALRYEIEDLQTIVSADIKEMIRTKHGELLSQPFVREALAEYQAFRGLLGEEVKRIKVESEGKIKELEDESRLHPYIFAESLSDAIATSTRR